MLLGQDKGGPLEEDRRAMRAFVYVMQENIALGGVTDIEQCHTSSLRTLQITVDHGG